MSSESLIPKKHAHEHHGKFLKLAQFQQQEDYDCGVYATAFFLFLIGAPDIDFCDISAALHPHPEIGTRVADICHFVYDLGLRPMPYIPLTRGWRALCAPALVNFQHEGDGHFGVVTAISRQHVSIFDPYTAKIIGLGKKEFVSSWYSHLNGKNWDATCMNPLDNLAFHNADGTTNPRTPSAVIPTVTELKEGEVRTGENDGAYPTTLSSHVARKPRGRRGVKPALLSPKEQLDHLNQRRENLAASNAKGCSKNLTVTLPIEVYARLVAMAENEAMAGSFRMSFPYFVSWCLLVGLKYYETYGLTHNNPDKIVFEEVLVDATPPMPPLGSPSDVRRTLEESVAPQGGPIHPILGRTIPRHPYQVPGGEQMSPVGADDDLQGDPRDWKDTRPGLMRGDSAFASEEMTAAVRAMLPASQR